MKIIWTHTFDNEKVKSSGIFMYQQIPFLEKAGIKIELVSFERLVNPFNIFRLLVLNHNKFENDIIHAQYGSGCGFLSSFLKAKKKILSLRGSDWYLLKKGKIKDRIHSWIARKMTLSSLSRYDEIIVMSNRMKLEILLEKPNFKVPIHVIPDFIDKSRFHQISKSVAKEKISNLIKKDPQKKWILFSSVLDNNPVKQASLAKEAFQIAKQKFSDIELIEMTNIPYDDVPYIINASEMVLLTSLHEGFPNIIKEALACNIPFISTDVSDLKSFADNKTNGCYVVPSDANSIAIAIIKTLENKTKNTILSPLIESMDISQISHKLSPIYMLNKSI